MSVLCLCFRVSQANGRDSHIKYRVQYVPESVFT